jgi:hypothetical protein
MPALAGPRLRCPHLACLGPGASEAHFIGGQSPWRSPRHRAEPRCIRNASLPIRRNGTGVLMSLWKFDAKRLRVDEGAVRKYRKIPQHENPDFTWGLNFGSLRPLPPNRFGATPSSTSRGFPREGGAVADAQAAAPARPRGLCATFRAPWRGVCRWPHPTSGLPAARRKTRAQDASLPRPSDPGPQRAADRGLRRCETPLSCIKKPYRKRGLPVQ